MPKIINDIEENIFNVAFELFGEYGYQQVDMKMIAKKIGIAVGTLYNYYPNKKQLYIAVFEKSWKNTFCKLDGIIEEKVSFKEKIRSMITTLYDEMSKRKGLGQELIKENVFIENERDKIFYIKEELLNKIEQLIRKVKEQDGLKLEDEMERRLAETIFMSIVNMTTEYVNEKEKNIRFITQFVECTYIK